MSQPAPMNRLAKAFTRLADQLGFDFDAPVRRGMVPASAQPVIVPGNSSQAHANDTTRNVATDDGSESAVGPTAKRSRTAARMQTAELFMRLQALGLLEMEKLVLMRTRTVMVSVKGRTLRINEGYCNAPDPVLRAIVTFASVRNRAARNQARDAILAYDVERSPATRRNERERVGDPAIVAALTIAHHELNARWFGSELKPIAIRLSGRMATRLGHFDPGTRLTPSEIVMSRGHIARHGWAEGMHTLLHEMVHQWQHETGRPVDHLGAFRKKCREVGITPSARRDVVPLRARRVRGAA